MKPKRTMILTLLLLAACQQEVVRPGKDSAAEIEAWSSGVSGTPVAQASKNKGPTIRAREDGPAWDWDDPCVENLQGLEGMLLLYYQLHHELPATLANLGDKAPDGEKVALACPTSSKAYVYNREGLVPPLSVVPERERAMGGDRLIIYDAEPAHEITQHLTDGTKDWDVKKTVRYGIVMKPVGIDGSLQLQVVPVEKDLLDAYLRETQARAKRGQPLNPPAVAPRPNSGGLW